MLLHNGSWREYSDILFDSPQLSIHCLRWNTSRSVSNIEDVRGL